MAKKQTIKKGPVKNEPEKTKAEKVQELLDKMNTKIPIADRVGPAKDKRFSEDKYVRISDDSGVEKFKEMSDAIQKGELRWAFYAIDGEKDGNLIGYHYYLKLKK